jgi:hypothetical protein
VDVDVNAAEAIFEEAQTTTVLAWNCNSRAAGWAAVGWASGVLLVRDLSVDL